MVPLSLSKAQATRARCRRRQWGAGVEGGGWPEEGGPLWRLCASVGGQTGRCRRCRSARRPNAGVGVAQVRLQEVVPPAGQDQRRDRRRAARPGRRLRAGRSLGSPLRDGHGLPRDATSTPSTEGHPVAVCLPDRPGHATRARPLLADTVTIPAGRSVGWGTSAMRTSGDDIAEFLALLGVSRLGRDVAPSRGPRGRPAGRAPRPRIDVTVRISGFFRDAFPNVVAMLDDAVRLVAGVSTSRRTELRPGHTAPTSSNTVITGGPPRGSSGRGLVRTAPGSCR